MLPARERRARSDRRVGRDDADLLDRDPERLGDERREGRVRAGHVGEGADERHAAVVVEPAGRAGRVRGAEPDSGGEAHPLAGRKLLAALPELVVAQALEALARAEDPPGLSVRPEIAFGGEVGHAEVERVDPQALGELVEERLQRERGGRRSRGAVGAEADPVRLDAVGADVVGLPAVDAADKGCGHALDAPFVHGAALEGDARLEAGQLTAAPRSDAQLDEATGCRVRRHEVFAAGERHAHGALQRKRGADGKRLDEPELAAERASQRHGHDPDRVDGQPEQPGQVAAHVERALRRRLDDEGAVRLGPRGRGLALEVGLMDPLGVEAALDDGVALRQRGLGILVAVPRSGDHVLGELLVVVRLVLARPAGGSVGAGHPGVLRLRLEASAGRSRLHRRLELDGGRQRLGIDHDERGPVLGRGLRLGDHERHGLAGEEDLLSDERLAGSRPGGLDQRQVGRGEHRDDAGDGERLLAADRA